MAFSLPYGLRVVLLSNTDKIYNHILYGIEFGGSNLINFKSMPILHPLPDITKEIEHNGEKFIPMIKLATLLTLNPEKISSTNEVFCQRKGRSSYSIFSFKGYNSFNLAIFRNSRLAYIDVSIDQMFLFQKLIEWHFDIAGLIDKCEAIDVNTLSNNPYK